MIMMGDSVAVRFDAMTKTYSGATVVDGLSLAIPKGIVYGLIGPNGAGKSTSLKTLMGLVKPSRGSVQLFGRELSELRASRDYERVRQRIGFVPEIHNVYRWMRVSEAIQFVKSFYPHWNDGIAADLMELFELDPKKNIKKLSKGMVAKLSLLLAVSHEPDLLVLDEPTSGLDPMVREEFLHGILRSIGENERTVIFSSHSISDVQRLADRVGVLRKGKLVLDQPVEDVLMQTKRLRAVFPSTAKAGWMPTTTVWQQAGDREWELTVSNFTSDMLDEFKTRNECPNVEVQDLSLEEIFKDFVRPGYVQTKMEVNA
jgi:ABC-2 type transport system ATP-binding protein